MKNIIKCLLGLILLFVGCTDNFKDLNKDPNEITDESLKQDSKDMGAYFPTLLGNIIRSTGGMQVDHNLVNDAFVRHMATPTPFVNNRNNTTYYITWNTYWDFVYGSVMAPVSEVIKIAKKNKNVMFENWAKLIRVIVAGRLTSFYGPIIYNNYGSSESTIKYDSEKDLYETLFKELDEILQVFNKNKNYKRFTNFDASYNGEIPKWIKLINSLRLRFAMRLAKANPTLAKQEGEKALSEAGGLIDKEGDSFYMSLYGREMRESVISFSWNDTRMSATMESVLVGYKDPRISKFFEPATLDKSTYPDNVIYKNRTAYPFKGVMASATLKNKDLRIPYSTVTKTFKTAKKRIVLSAAEVLFLKAEAALRGWSGAGTAKDNYENAVKASFAQWGASGAEAYLQNDSSFPIDYVDVVAPEFSDTDPKKDYNNFKSRIKVTVKWDDANNNEKKLERIITQKWIAFFTNSVEAWVDHRRTGYPKLPYNNKNDSNADFGIIGAKDFIRRMPFVLGEINNNPKGVEDAVKKLKNGKGKNGNIGAMLYFDTDNLGKDIPINF